MPIDEQYRRQVTLLVRVLPLVAEESCFALKGGTAINLFIRDMPRLSVDIDLAYLPISDRESSLRDIDVSLRRIAERIRSHLPGINVREGELKDQTTISRLIVRSTDAHIIIEVTPVLRGCVEPPAVRSVTTRAEAEFGYAEIQVAAFADLYAGKLVAALDRQHPRDLFDARDLLANEGIDDRLRDAFIVYLLSHNRPMADVLAPTRHNIQAEFERGFIGMTDVPVKLDDLLATRERIISTLVHDMPDHHRNFLISFKQGSPDWDLLGIPDAVNLPAVRWRMQNLRHMSDERRSVLLARLQKVLYHEQ